MYIIALYKQGCAECEAEWTATSLMKIKLASKGIEE